MERELSGHVGVAAMEAPFDYNYNAEINTNWAESPALPFTPCRRGVVKRLKHALPRDADTSFFAFYSSEIGSIVTDPTMMVSFASCKCCKTAVFI